LEGVADTASGPEARYQSTEAVELAFIVALQHLLPRQAATLVLRDVLGFSTAEVAGMLDSSETAIKGALQRARRSLEPHRSGPRTGAYIASGLSPGTGLDAPLRRRVHR